jgi:hypothetical protein
LLYADHESIARKHSMKKTEWNEGSVARRKAAGKGKGGERKTTATKAVHEMAARREQANFSAEVLQDAIKGIINNQVP